MSSDHGGILFLAAEGAARFHLHDANMIGGQVEKFHERFVDVIGALQGAPDGEALPRIEGGDHAVVFDVKLLLRAGGVLGFDDVVRALPGRVNVALFDQITFEQIVRAPDDLGEAFTFLDGEDCGKWIVFDGDGFGCFGKEMAIRMSEEKNRLFGMIDDAVRETGLIVFDKRDAIAAGNIAARDDDKFAPIHAGTEGDLLDFAAGDAAANSGAEKHAGREPCRRHSKPGR